MGRYLLDTSALIDFSKGPEPVRSALLRMFQGTDLLAVTAVNMAEFYAGLEPRHWPAWDEFFAVLPVWPISPGAARQAGIWRYQFRLQGVQLATTDVLIAAVAVEQHAVLITRNVRHYPMPEVSLLTLAS
jgi:predicted nucleic acid-binding protein